MTERFYAFKEMLEHEKSFHKQLKYVFGTMYPGYKERENPHDAGTLSQTIFGALKPILELSASLTQQLEEALTKNKQDPHCGAIFVQSGQKLAGYSQFILNHESSFKLLQERMKKNKKVKEFIETSLEKNDQLTSKDLHAIFVLPFQHLCRYKLYLDRILKASEGHSEYETLKNAVIVTVGAINTVNQFFGEQTNRLKLREIVDKLDFSEYELQNNVVRTGMDLVINGRVLCDEKDVFSIKSSKFAFVNTSNAKLYRFFVFNDMIICTREQKSVFSREVKYKVKRIFNIDALFNILADTYIAKNAAQDSYPYQFILKYANNQALFAAQTEKAKAELVTQIQSLVEKQHQFLAQRRQTTSEKTQLRQPCDLCLMPHKPALLSQCCKCLRQACERCFFTANTQSMCTNCAQKMELMPIHPSLIPAFRSYRCLTPAEALTPNMLGLKQGDEVEVYHVVAQTWAYGRNTTQFNTVGVFYLPNCTVNTGKDLGPRQNMGLFAGVYEPVDAPTPRLAPGANAQKFFASPTPETAAQLTPTTGNKRHTFTKQIDVGDVIVVTSIGGDENEWYFGKSLRTNKYGYVHCDDLKIIPGTVIPSNEF